MATATITEQEIPCPSCWRHRPVFMKAGDDTKVFGVDANEPLPLGIPVEFETPLFKGRILVRLRNAKTDDRDKHDAYFEGRRRVMQHVVQGKFKKQLSMADLQIGCIYKKPMRLVPPSSFMKLVKIMMEHVASGCNIDLASKRPKVLALYGGSAQTISIDLPGQEPDMTARDIAENVRRKFGDTFQSIKHRKKALSTPKVAKRYHFDTQHVYTFHDYDQSIDYGTYTIKLPVFGNFALGPAIGAQPMGLSAVTTNGDVIFSFDVWHESVYDMKLDDDKRALHID